MFNLLHWKVGLSRLGLTTLRYKWDCESLFLGICRLLSMFIQCILVELSKCLHYSKSRSVVRMSLDRLVFKCIEFWSMWPSYDQDLTNIFHSNLLTNLKWCISQGHCMSFFMVNKKCHNSPTLWQKNLDTEYKNNLKWYKCTNSLTCGV